MVLSYSHKFPDYFDAYILQISAYYLRTDPKAQKSQWL